MERQRVIPPDHAFDGGQLRAARKGAKLSLWELSRALARYGDTNQGATIREWEVGVSNPRVNTFFRICFILKKPPEFFMRSDPSVRSIVEARHRKEQRAR